MWEERPNGQCVLCDVPEALLHDNRTAKPMFILAGSAGLVPQRKPTNLTLRRQGVVRGLRRDGCMGRARQNRTQPGGEVSD
jgi:hypothetical protein